MTRIRPAVLDALTALVDLVTTLADSNGAPQMSASSEEIDRW